MEVDSWCLTIIMQYLMHHLHVGFGSMLAFTHAAQSAQTGHSPCDQIRFVSTHVVTGFLQRSPSTTSNTHVPLGRSRTNCMCAGTLFPDDSGMLTSCRTYMCIRVSEPRQKRVSI